MDLKRLFDIVLSGIGLIFLGWLILILILLAYFDTGKGIFLQKRIGQYGKPFNIYKISSIKVSSRSISKFGKFLRKSKVDELPQLLNVFFGQMSFVGPRPDIPGYYDKLEGEDRKILELKPGLTSEASLKYYNEESILKNKDEPLDYNDTVIFPDKVKMNLEYYYKQSFTEDLRIILKTISIFFRK
ncbi:MAG: sugar transferase [Aequorivita sp.]|nr:sugar transferase [Aequorivita sp.]